MKSLIPFLCMLCLTIKLTPEHVARVIDGDTFVVHAFDAPPEERIRVLGVNTPEKGEPKWAEAKQFTEAWLAEGNFDVVTCAKDSFGRRLATVTRATGTLAAALREAKLGK